MNRNRIVITFKYWTAEDYENAREFVYMNSRHLTLQDEFPDFWITAHSKVPGENLRLIEDLMVYMKGDDK